MNKPLKLTSRQQYALDLLENGEVEMPFTAPPDEQGNVMQSYTRNTWFIYKRTEDKANGHYEITAYRHPMEVRAFEPWIRAPLLGRRVGVIERGYAMKTNIEAWAKALRTCDDNDIHRVDVAGAESCGLHALAELIRLRGDLERAHGPVSGHEVIARLAPIIALARGEAQDRLRIMHKDESLIIPGVVAFKQ